MLIRACEIEEKEGRRGYPVGPHQDVIQHFAARMTTPDNPFRPHQHERQEFWYIVEGQAMVRLDGEEHVVEAGDLVLIAPWTEHGLRTEGVVHWICFG